MAFSNHSEVCVPSLELGEQKNAAGSSHSNNGEAPRLNGRPQIFGSTMQEILFVFTATMSVAMPSFLQGSTLVVTSQIQKDLGMTTSQLTWMTASSSLTCGSFLLCFGTLADTFGRRGILLAGLVSFVVLALAAGFSKNGLVLDVLNGVMGLSSAATIPSAQGILGSIYERPSKRKNVVFAWITAGNHLGFVLSSIFSGVAAQLFGWSASFWLLAIIYTAVASIAYFVVPCEEEQKLKSALELVKRLDFLGAALIVCGIGLLTVGISIGSDAPEGWSTFYVPLSIVLGLTLIAIFVWWECRHPYPLMPMRVWRDKNFSLLLIILSLGFLSFPPLFFFVALYLQELFEYSTLLTAVCLLPSAVSGIIINFIVGRLLHKVSNKLLMAIGAIAFSISFLLAAFQRLGDSYWAFTFPALALVVVGTDLEFNVVNMYVVSSLPKSQQSTAGSIFQTIIKLAVTTGLAICASIFASVSKNPATSGFYAHDPFEPYDVLFCFSAATSFLSLLLVPLLKINTQSHKG